MIIFSNFLKFIYSEKAIQFWEIFHLLLTTVHKVKSKGKIWQNFVAFSEYMNFNFNKHFHCAQQLKSTSKKSQFLMLKKMMTSKMRMTMWMKKSFTNWPRRTATEQPLRTSTNFGGRYLRLSRRLECCTECRPYHQVILVSKKWIYYLF